MSRLHKKIGISLLNKLYICFGFLILYGIYKNALLPFLSGYVNVFTLLKIVLIPIISFLIGYLIDLIFKNKDMFGNSFFALLFSMFIPYSTNLIVYLIFLSLLLFFYNLILRKKDSDLNFICLGKILLVIILMFLNVYSYQNNMEISGVYQYTLIDQIFGHSVGGLYITNSFLIILSFIFLSTDIYYKKEIPFYSYGVYVIILLFASIIKQDMSFFLLHICNCDVLFALVFIATLSLFSPYTKKKTLIYSILLGLLIVPLSIRFNFHEGAYVAILIANLLIVILSVIRRVMRKSKKVKFSN